MVVIYMPDACHRDMSGDLTLSALSRVSICYAQNVLMRTACIGQCVVEHSLRYLFLCVGDNVIAL